jgi:hypothetical protein
MTFKHSLAATLLALALPAVAAASAAPAPGVAPGSVEHTVTTRVIEQLVPHRKLIQSTVSDSWVGATRSRLVDKDAVTGALLDECTSSSRAWSCYYRDRNVIEKSSGRNPLLLLSWAQQGWDPLELKRQGYRKLRDGTDLGRPVGIYRKRFHGWARGHRLVRTYDTIDVDRATGVALRRVIERRATGSTIRQTQTVTALETLDASRVSMAMSPHPGAKVKRVKAHVSPIA